MLDAWPILLALVGLVVGVAALVEIVVRVNGRALEEVADHEGCIDDGKREPTIEDIRRKAGAE